MSDHYIITLDMKQYDKSAASNYILLYFSGLLGVHSGRHY